MPDSNHSPATPLRPTSPITSRPQVMYWNIVLYVCVPSVHQSCVYATPAFPIAENPLARAFLILVESGRLQSHPPELAREVALSGRKCSYWRSNHERIEKQSYVWMDGENQSSDQTQESSRKTGVILPELVPAGTVTRRSVEPTWMTASNIRPDSIGSEIKAMVQAPEGLMFVGADVDSEEMWIACLLGDAHTIVKQHGATPASCMLLRGNRADGSDLHSFVARELQISRDHAKVLNYGRLYGAGMNYAIRLLNQFNPQLGMDGATEKAKKLYYATKGRAMTYYKLNGEGMQALACLAKKLEGQKRRRNDRDPLWFVKEQLNRGVVAKSDLLVPTSLVKQICIEQQRSVNELVVEQKKIWINGTESEMFNALEEIALGHDPQTPTLGAHISTALRREFVGTKQFTPARINWVVQSSGVDYLHLLLVAIRHLCATYGIDSARYAVSIHDDVRYLVDERQRYQCAWALQVASIYTRAHFCASVGIHDLPLSVATFSTVDIDRCLRKKVDDECKTPSLPAGIRTACGIEDGEAIGVEDLVEVLEKADWAAK